MIDSPIIGRFGGISLEEMDSVKLMNRTDSKYVTSQAVLESILEDAVRGGYRCLEIGGKRLQPYLSVYFDTPSMEMFTAHRNGKARRQKVRTREYVDSGLCFLEIKRKDNHGRTKKVRRRISPEILSSFAPDKEACAFLEGKSGYGAESLSGCVETSFNRITLVNPEKTERLTIDTSLEFGNLRTGKRADLGDAVIIELKQDGRKASAMKSIFLRHRVKPFRVSKYCIGVTLTDADARSGRFRQKARAIGKITGKQLI